MPNYSALICHSEEQATKNLKTSPVRKRFFALLRMTRDLHIAVATDAMYGVPTFPQSA